MSRLRLPFVLICCLVAVTPIAAQQETQTTTWYIVRHADRDGDKDQLTKSGEERAELLKELMKSLRVDAVYSTDTKRTQDTAAPTARELGLAVKSYGKLSKEWFEKIKNDHRGGVVLIVAHSNTSGKIVEGLGGTGDFSIDEDEYDSLFVVTTGKNKDIALRLKFGAKPNSEKK